MTTPHLLRNRAIILCQPGSRPASDNRAMARKKKPTPIDPYRRLRKRVPPPGRAIPDRRRELEEKRARREAEEEEEER